MKLLLLFFVGVSFGQTINFSDSIKEGTYKEYVSKNGFIIKENQKIRIGYPTNGNKFTYITQGTEMVDCRLNNILVEVSKIEAIKLNNNYCKVYIFFKGFGLIPVAIDIEAALHFNEIITQ
jgi:hypothetical protein